MDGRTSESGTQNEIKSIICFWSIQHTLELRQRQWVLKAFCLCLESSWSDELVSFSFWWFISIFHRSTAIFPMYNSRDLLSRVSRPTTIHVIIYLYELKSRVFVEDAYGKTIVSLELVFLLSIDLFVPFGRVVASFAFFFAFFFVVFCLLGRCSFCCFLFVRSTRMCLAIELYRNECIHHISDIIDGCFYCFLIFMPRRLLLSAHRRCAVSDRLSFIVAMFNTICKREGTSKDDQSWMTMATLSSRGKIKTKTQAKKKKHARDESFCFYSHTHVSFHLMRASASAVKYSDRIAS